MTGRPGDREIGGLVDWEMGGDIQFQIINHKSKVLNLGS